MDNQRSTLEVFLDGTRRGIDIWLKTMLPASVLGFTLIRILEITGVLNILDLLFAPFMRIFGLPGEGMAVLVTAWMDVAGGCGAAASFAMAGKLTGAQVTILMPMVFLIGGQAQFIGRVLVVAGVRPNRYAVMCAISIINALVAGLIMRLLV